MVTHWQLRRTCSVAEQPASCSSIRPGVEPIMASTDAPVLATPDQGLPRQETAAPSPQPVGFTPKMFVIGGLGVVFSCWFGLNGAMVAKTTPLVSGYFPLVAPLVFLLVLFLVNPLLRLIRWELDQSELAVVFVMIYLGAILSFDGFTAPFLSGLMSPYYRATLNNDLWAKVPPFAYTAPEAGWVLKRQLLSFAVLFLWAIGTAVMATSASGSGRWQ